MWQHGGKHLQAKPLKGFGSAGVLEIIEDDDGNTYRAVIQFVLVMPCMRFIVSKSHKDIETPKQDMDLIRDRLKLAQHHAEGVKK